MFQLQALLSLLVKGLDLFPETIQVEKIATTLQVSNIQNYYHLYLLLQKLSVFIDFAFIWVDTEELFLLHLIDLQVLQLHWFVINFTLIH